MRRFCQTQAAAEGSYIGLVSFNNPVVNNNSPVVISSVLDSSGNITVDGDTGIITISEAGVYCISWWFHSDAVPTVISLVEGNNDVIGTSVVDTSFNSNFGCTLAMIPANGTVQLVNDTGSSRNTINSNTGSSGGITIFRVR